MSELAVHPVAALFPMLADDELEELATDIKARGLLQPIVLDVEGRVLDGRNRLAACKKAGVKPDFITYANGDPDGYALAVNINRRHLRPAARYLIIAKALTLPNLQNCKKGEIAEKAGVPLPRLSEASLVLDYKDLCDEIFAELLSLESAVKTARQRNADAAAKKEKKERLKQCAPDLYGLVEENRHDIDEALAALKCREDKALAEAEAAKENARAEMEADARRTKELEEERKQQRWAATSNLIDGILLFDRHQPGDGVEMATAYDRDVAASRGEKITPQRIRNAIAFLEEVATAMERNNEKTA
jgi:hypothetical protein